MKLIAQADVVVALGFTSWAIWYIATAWYGLLAKNAKIIQIDASHNKMLGLVKKILVGICGDAKAAAVALTKRLEGKTLACDATKAER